MPKRKRLFTPIKNKVKNPMKLEPKSVQGWYNKIFV